MASHWNAQGNVDGYLSKNIALFFIPVFSLFLWLLFLILPIIDPYKKNLAQFRPNFNIFIVLFFTFFAYLYFLTIFWNLGFRFNLIRYLSPAFAVLFFDTGILISRSKRNWFIGIRTPWTLSSDKIWAKTHHLGGKLFKACALLTFLGVFFPKLAIYLLLIPVLATTVIVIAYSYLEYQKTGNK